MLQIYTAHVYHSHLFGNTNAYHEHEQGLSAGEELCATSQFKLNQRWGRGFVKTLDSTKHVRHPQWCHAHAHTSVINEWDVTGTDKYKVTWVMVGYNSVPWGLSLRKKVCQTCNFLIRELIWRESCARISMSFPMSAVWLRRDEKVRESSCCITLFTMHNLFFLLSWQVMSGCNTVP